MLLSEFLAIVVAMLSSVLLAVWWVSRSQDRTIETQPMPDQDVALLFEDGVMSHASARAEARFGLQTGIDEWEDLQDAMADAFPKFPSRPVTDTEGSLTLHPVNDSGLSRAHVSWRGSLARVVVSEMRPPSGDEKPASCHAQEFAALRRMNESLPDPVWQTDKDGNVTWHNPAYAKLCTLVQGEAPNSGIPLFDLGGAQIEAGQSARIPLKTSDKKVQDWFSVFNTSGEGGSVFCASNINAVVRAEETQRNFVQTLAKTFAHLSTGLAIFDRNQQLVLFNPALVDLTGLQAEFLSGRPNILSFFDRLRENRRMPEPKNYRNWRLTISELIAAANDGRFQETWSLETGQTYRVTGRPHPDGATAFLIEDISAEVTLTRNFRAELELGQSLLDTLEEGLAVFSVSGVQTFSNKAYRKMWRLNPDASFADVTVNDSIQAWKQATQTSSRWQEIEDFVLSYGDRQAWEMGLALKDGREAVCHLKPIASGATLIRFQLSQLAAEIQTQPAL